jgi:dCTP deaminase
MILSDKHIVKALKHKKLIISPTVSADQIRSNHIDLHLWDTLCIYTTECIDLKSNSIISHKTILLDPAVWYKLEPWTFVLGTTSEHISLVNKYTWYIQTRWNIARAGIQIHNNNWSIEPGFSWHISLQIKNNANHTIIIYPGMLFAQISISRCTSKVLNPYNGKYQHQIWPSFYLKD